jgi:hypothetical protein
MSVTDEDTVDMPGNLLKGYIRNEYQTRYDNGHEFSTEKNEYKPLSRGHVLTVQSGAKQWWKYSGDLVFSPTDGVYFPSISFPNLATRQINGTKAIAHTTPTQSEVALAAIFGEAAQRLPQFMGTEIARRGLTTKSIGGEFLNLVFGIAPTKSDIQSLARSIRDFSRNAKAYEKRADLNIRRRVTLRDERTATDVASTGALKICSLTGTVIDYTSRFLNTGTSQARVVTVTHEITKFSGAYTYHLSRGHSFLDKMPMYEQLANHLLGVEINLDTAWELTPWSWLSDWFFDASEFIHNIQALQPNSLVLRYGYVMHEIHADRITTVTLRPSTNFFGFGPASTPATASFLGTRVKKTRDRSTPYGFGLDVSGFSAQRWAILAALGLSKAPALALKRDLLP